MLGFCTKVSYEKIVCRSISSANKNYRRSSRGNCVFFGSNECDHGHGVTQLDSLYTHTQTSHQGRNLKAAELSRHLSSSI